MNKKELAEKAFEEMLAVGAVKLAADRMRERADKPRGLIRTMLDIRKSMIVQFYDVPKIENAFGLFGSRRRNLIVFFTHLDLDSGEVRKAAGREKGKYRFFLVRETEERRERVRGLIKKLEEFELTD